MRIEIGQPCSFKQLGKRNNQEDSRFPDNDTPQQCAPFFLVCDGVGGCDKGEVASSIVCDTFANELSKVDWEYEFTIEDFQKVFTKAFNNVEKASTGERKGMATTLTFVCFHAAGCMAAHIGDSRIYHVRPNVGIMYRSDDHSLVNALVHSGNLTPDAAINHPDDNIITRYIGAAPNGEDRSKATVIQIKDIEVGDYFFLCSDGVLKCVEDKKLVDILSSDVSDEDKMRGIAHLSKNSDDNNTAYLIPIIEVEKEPTMDYVSSSTGSTTYRIEVPVNIASEVSPDAKATFGSKILSFVNRLFN